MSRKHTILSVQTWKKVTFAFLLTGLAALSFAAMGDGDKPKLSLSRTGSFSPVRITSSFTLKAKPSYRGSLTFNDTHTTTANYMNFNSLVTYQKGNTTYIIPYRSRVSITPGKSGLQAISVKVTIHR